MAIERTLSIIKPDAVAKNVIGQIYSRFTSRALTRKSFMQCTPHVRSSRTSLIS